MHFCPLTKVLFDPFARQYCIRFAQLDQLPVPYASAQFANELAAAVKRSEDAFAAGTTRREVSLPTVALCVHENVPALLFPSIELADVSALDPIESVGRVAAGAAHASDQLPKHLLDGPTVRALGEVRLRVLKRRNRAVDPRPHLATRLRADRHCAWR